MAVVCFGGARATAQTFEVNGPAQTSPAKPQKGQKAGAKAPAAAQTQNGFGWGSSIEVGRNSRAAEDALKHNNPAAAATFSKRAAEAAPQNAKLWFLYGYASRLAGRTQESIAAYKRGLSIEPKSVDGLSGLAQSYIRGGNTDEAKRLLAQVINANPKRTNDLLIAGELFIKTGDAQQGLNYLERAEAQQPSAHAEVMMAMAFMKLKQKDRAKALLEKAKKRDPKNTDIFRAVATFYRDDKQYDDAIATLKSAPGRKTDVLADLAFTYDVAGHRQEAADAYAQVAAAEPSNINFQLSAANAYLRLNDMAKTQLFMKKAAAIDPDNYRLHALNGAIAKMNDRPQDAIREYTLALAKIPDGAPEGQLYPVQLRLNLSELYRDVGDEASAKQQMVIAEQEMSKLEVSGPARAEFLRVRAAVRLGGDDLKGAEADLQEAFKLDPTNLNVPLQYANLLWRDKRRDEARKMYLNVLKQDPKNRFALEGLGYIAREENNIPEAQRYFTMLTQANPADYVGYLALGDMYTSLNRFDQADQSYQIAYKNAPKNSTVVANGANAAIEAHKFGLAKSWIDRTTPEMLSDPRVLREKERYLFHTGKFAESAALGYKVLEQLPKDRNASVYLAYDLYDLGRYDDTLALVTKYSPLLPREPNFPLLAGHVHKQSQLLGEAVDDYSRAIERDPKMTEAYVNRGYVFNDLQNAERAIQDFNTALKLNPDNGVAQLGIAFSDLQLRRGKDALDHANRAQQLLGENGPVHLVRATAYREMRLLDKAEPEYRAALKYSPDDLGLHLALAETLYDARKYQDSIAALSDALRLSPDDPLIYAQLAHSNAQLHRRDETLKYVQYAEKQGGDMSSVLLSTGEALMTLGDHDAAMERFSRALQAPDADRVAARLAIAELFLKRGNYGDAKQQVGLAFAESRIGEAAPVTADDYIEAANIFLAGHDFDLATKYFEAAGQAGAGDEPVALGLANTYLAMGNDRAAEKELQVLGNPADNTGNYDYELAYANMYQQRHDSVHALGAFARANAISNDNDVAVRQEEQVADEVGLPVGGRFSTNSDVQFHGIFEDETIYMLDARLFGGAGATLPPPRSSSETIITNDFHYNAAGLPPLFAGVQLRSARGQVSLPSEDLILNRNTVDTQVHAGISPSLRFGSNHINLNTGIAYTMRRDSLSGPEIDQNLFRQDVYLSTSSFFNWLALRGSAFHESGGFTLRSLNSTDTGATLEWTVGRPWGKTALLTGWSARDLKFNPLIREFYTTSTYAGLERKFGRKLTLDILGEYIRAWRVQDRTYVTAQALAPGARFEYQPSLHWSVDGKFTLERGESLHSYDNVQSAFFISYVKPLRSSMDDGFGTVPVSLPIRLSFGIQQEMFMNFTGRGQSLFRPIVRLTLF